MPLKCLRGEQEIYAFDVDTDGGWTALREHNAHERDLAMACCGAGVVLRESKLGTRHFAHARRGPCSTAPETAEHLLAKRMVIEGIRATDWLPRPEQSGVTRQGEAWRADVLAVKRLARVAFEIQWSRQQADETERRQRRYADAGVRGLWLFRQHDLPVSRDIPAFRLALDATARRFHVQLPSPEYDPEYLPRREADKPRYWQQTVPLDDFVTGALSGRLHFAPALGRQLPVEVRGSYGQCLRCHRNTGHAAVLRFAVDRVIPGAPDIEIPLLQMGSRWPDGEAWIQAQLPAPLLARYGIGEFKRRLGHRASDAYFSLGCIHCDAQLHGDDPFTVAYSKHILLELRAVFEPQWGPLLTGTAASALYRWVFDARSDVPLEPASSTLVSSQDCA